MPNPETLQADTLEFLHVMRRHLALQRERNKDLSSWQTTLNAHVAALLIATTDEGPLGVNWRAVYHRCVSIATLAARVATELPTPNDGTDVTC